MNTIVVTSTKQNIKFGYEGEDNVTKIVFPYDESWLEYGEGNFEVRILRCGDEVAYTATDVVDDRQAMTLTMTVTDIELSVRGRGEMQLCYVCPDSIKKSPIYQYTVNRSVDYKYAVDPPDGSIIASVEKSLSEIKNTTNRLSNSVISIESSINDVNSQIDNINNKISEFDEEIDSVGEVETRVDNLETSIGSINGRINTAEGNINENTESISDLNESVTALENKKVTDLETSGGKSDSGKYLTVGTDGKVKATSLTIPPTITVDDSLSTTSKNPVQNKVIKTELNNINSNIETCNTEISKINGSLDDVQGQIDYWTTKNGYSVNPVASASGGDTGLGIGTYSTTPIYLVSFTPVLNEGERIGWRYVSVESGFTKNATYNVIKSGIVNAGETIEIRGILDSTHAIVLGGTGIAVKTKAGNVASAHNYLKAFYGNKAVSSGMTGKCLAGTFFFVPLEEDKRITIDKSIVMMGDSITNLKTTRSWIEYMKGYLAFNTVTEYAHDGARWRNFSDTVYDISDYSDSSHNNTIYNQINKLKNATDNETVSTPDVVVILAGTNDVSDANNIGDITTAFSSTTPVINDDVATKLTVVESIRYCVELLRSYYPDVQIIIGSPLQRSTYPDNVRLMRDAIKGCAARLSVGFINQTDESGIDYYTEVNAHKYLADGLHPNAAGAKIVGEFISLKLQSMIR